MPARARGYAPVETLKGHSTLAGASDKSDASSVSSVLAYVAAGVVLLWGIAHVVPTAKVVEGYRDTSHDNRLVITQEWIAEAMTMWFMAAVVVLATAAGGSHQALTNWIYRASAIMLISIAVLTALTGARTPIVFFKICVILLSLTAALLIWASMV